MLQNIGIGLESIGQSRGGGLISQTLVVTTQIPVAKSNI